MTAFYDNTIGELRRDPVKAQQYEKLVWEAASVGRAKGVALTDEHINAVIHKFRHVHADNATSSLQRDFRIRRKQTELEPQRLYCERSEETGCFHSAFRKNISGTYGNGRKILTEKGEFFWWNPVCSGTMGI